MGWTRIQTKKVSWCQISKKNTILHFSRCILPDSTVSKEPACQCRRHKRCGFNPCIRKIPWSRKWQPTPVFLPGKSHGQTSLEGYSPWGRKESNMTEHAHTHTFLMPIIIWWDFPRGSLVKNLPAMLEMWVWSLGREDPLERKQQHSPVFLPGKSHGQRILAGYNPWCYKRTRHDLQTKQQHNLDNIKIYQLTRFFLNHLIYNSHIKESLRPSAEEVTENSESLNWDHDSFSSTSNSKGHTQVETS